MNVRFKTPSVRQAGFGFIAVIAILAMVAITGLIGYRLYSDTNHNVAAPNSSEDSKLDVTAAPQINKASDLNNAETVLNQVDSESASSNDSSQLDKQLDSF